MAIPKYHEMYKPFLDCIRDGKPHKMKEIKVIVASITTARFTKEAVAYAEKQHTTKVVLVDGAMLTKLMIEYNLGVSTETMYEIKKLDTDFFNDEDL